MPLYICSTPREALDDGQRRRIAESLTNIHCELTGAPPTFVHVVFDESKARGYSVYGRIRAGRTDETKAEIVRRMASAVAETVGTEETAVGVVTVDVPASWVMEGGALLPEPGDEADWLESHGS